MFTVVGYLGSFGLEWVKTWFHRPQKLCTRIFQHFCRTLVAHNITVQMAGKVIGDRQAMPAYLRKAWNPHVLPLFKYWGGRNLSTSLKGVFTPWRGGGRWKGWWSWQYPKTVEADCREPSIVCEISIAHRQHILWIEEITLQQLRDGRSPLHWYSGTESRVYLWPLKPSVLKQVYSLLTRAKSLAPHKGTMTSTRWDQ